MTIDEGLSAFLLANAGVVALIEDRLEPGFIPRGDTFPALTYHRQSSTRTYAMDGPVGLATPRYQFGCWGATFAQAKTLSEALRKAIDGYVGLMGTVKVQAVFIENDSDQPAPDPESDESSSYGVLVDVTIWHTET